MLIMDDDLINIDALKANTFSLPSAPEMNPLLYHRTGNVQRRGFKSSLLSTARGFGKRSSQYDKGVSDLMTTAIGFGKRSAPLRQDIRSDLYPKELSRYNEQLETKQAYL